MITGQGWAVPQRPNRHPKACERQALLQVPRQLPACQFDGPFYTAFSAEDLMLAGDAITVGWCSPADRLGQPFVNDLLQYLQGNRALPEHDIVKLADIEFVSQLLLGP